MVFGHRWSCGHCCAGPSRGSGCVVPAALSPCPWGCGDAARGPGTHKALQDTQLGLQLVFGASQGCPVPTALPCVGARSGPGRLVDQGKAHPGISKAALFVPGGEAGSSLHHTALISCSGVDREANLCVRRAWEQRCCCPVCRCQVVPLAGCGYWESFALFPFASQRVPVFFPHPFLCLTPRLCGLGPGWWLLGPSTALAGHGFPPLCFPKATRQRFKGESSHLHL